MIRLSPESSAMVNSFDCPPDVVAQLSELIQRFSVQMGTCYDTASCVLLYDLLSKYFSTDDILLAAESHFEFQKHFQDVINDVCGFPVADRVLQRLELFFLTGLMEFCQNGRPTERSKPFIDFGHRIAQRLLHYLAHGCSDFHALVISVVERWWLWYSTLNNENEAFNNEFMAALNGVFSGVIMHWDSDDSMTIRQIRHFLTSVLSKSQESRMDVISLIHASILGSPSCKHGCVMLHKGAVNLLTPILQQLGPIKVLEYSPHLTTSLLMALGHNYTAATAADALNVLLMHGSDIHTSEDKHTWLEYVLDPVLNYIFFENINCSMAQELLGSNVASSQSIRQNRRENFANQCFIRKFCTLKLPGLPISAKMHAYFSTKFTSDLSLAEMLLWCLCSVDLKQDTRRSSTGLHRLFLWLKLFAVYGNKTELMQNRLDISPLLSGLLHADDHIRSLALIGIANLGSTFLSRWDHLADQLEWTYLTDIPPGLMRFFVIGAILLQCSPSPMARKALLSALDELIRSVRNACSSLRNATTRSGASFSRVFPENNRGWLPELSLGPLASPCLKTINTKEWTRQELALVWLAQFVDFQSHLWNHASLSGSHLFPFLPGLFWPGMTYQRCKVLTEIAHHAIGLCNLEHTTNGNNAMSQWRTGYTPNSIDKLRRLIRILSSELKWPFDAPDTLSSMLQSLPVLKPDIQTQLFELVEQNWPEMSQIPVSKFNPGCVPHWLEQAMHWSDSHLWSVYTAGGNALAFLAKRGYLKHYEGQHSLDLVFSEKLQRFRGVFLADSQEQGKLLHVAQNETGFGYLMAIDQILTYLCTGRPSDQIPDNLCRFLTSNQLATICFDLCNYCLGVMGCQQWSGMDYLNYAEYRQGASSFRELGQSVLRAALSGLHSSSGDENPPAESDVSVFESIELLPEYQHVLSWSWNTLRLCCNILAQWSALQQQQNQKRQEEQDQQHTRQISDYTIDTSVLCTRIGYQLLHVLLHCRHRGTVEAVSSSLQLYLIAADSYVGQRINDRGSEVHSSHLALITCEQVMEVCWKVLRNYSYSVTRRAAGLWPAFKAALSAERARGKRHAPVLLICWLDRLIKLASPNSDNGINDFRVDSPRALAMHLLRGLFADANLRAHTQSITFANQSKNFVVEAIQHAVLPGFTASVWTISNAALQLHSALVLRLTGSNSGRPPPSATAVFNRHVPLLEVCVNRLEDHIRLGANSSAAELLPLLTLIVRMAPGSAARSPLSIRMRTGLEHVLLHHTTAAIRQLAASAYLVFVPSELDEEKDTLEGSAQQCVLCKIGSIGPWRLIRVPACCPTRSYNVSDPCSANAIHGQLCLLRAWYKQPVANRLLIQRQSLFDWSTSLNLLHQLMLGHKNGSGSWYVAALLCDLMTCVFMAVDNPYSNSSLRPAVMNWYQERAQYLRCPPSHQAFHVEAIIALYKFLDRVCGNAMDVPSDLVNLSGWPVNCLQRLLGALLDTDDPRDSALFAAPAVKYWLEYPAPQENLLFSWQVVHAWASAIRSGRTVMADCSDLLNVNHRAIKALQTLLDTGGPGSTDAVNRANVLLCEAFLLSGSFQPMEADLDHWLSHLSNCLYPACLEPARLTGSEAILLWLNGFGSSCVEETNTVSMSMVTRLCQVLTLQQRHRFLSLLFSTVFDESVEVRHTISRCITIVVGTSSMQNTLPLLAPGFTSKCDQPIAHLVAAHLILYELLPALLPREYDASDQETTVWLKSRWMEVMSDLNRRLVEEFMMHQRNVLYEREADNDFCEPRLLLELIVNRLHKEALTVEQWDNLCEELRYKTNEHLSKLLEENYLTTDVENVCGMSTPTQSFSPTLFARQLGLTCLLREH